MISGTTRGAASVRLVAGHVARLLGGTALAVVLAGAEAMAAEPATQRRTGGAVVAQEPASRAQADVRRNFAIARQPLSQALIRFSQETGIELFFDATLAQGVMSPGVSGTLSAEDALRRVLEGTGIVHRFTNPTTVTLERAPARANEPTRFPPVTVTADRDSGYTAPTARGTTKTDTPIRDTPASIKVIPRAVLDDQQVIRLEDALRNVSSVVYSESAEQKGFNSRGFGAQVLIDGVSKSEFTGGSTNDFDLETYNIERIEVLKGPASALYGRGNPGGIINVITKQPRNEAHYGGGVTVGSHGLGRPSFDVGGPVTSDRDWLYRVNGVYERADSFRDEVKSERFFVMPAVTWQGNKGTKIRADIEYGEIDETPDSGVPRANNSGYIVNGIPISRFLGEPSDYRRLGKEQGRVFLDHDLNSDWAIHAIAAASRATQNQYFTRAGTLQANGIFLTRTVRDDSTTNVGASLDLNMTGNFDLLTLHHKVLVGGTTDWRQTDALFKTYNTSNPINIFNPVYGNRGTLTLSGRSDVVTERRLNGIYVQDQIDLLPNLKISLGGRYDHYEEEQVTNNTSPPSKSDGKFSPNAGIVFKPIEPVSLYAAYAESFQTTPGFTTQADGSLIGPETGELYEAGVKVGFFDDRLTASVAVYKLTRQNLPTPDPNNPGFQIPLGEQESRGVEFEIGGEIQKGWNVIGAFGYTDPKITADNNAAIIGKRVVNVPSYTAGIWSTYEFQSAPLLGFGVVGGAQYVGTREGNNTNTYRLGAYTRFDAGVFYKFERLTTRFSVNNITDEEILVSQGGNFLFPGEPRSFLLSAYLQF